MIEHGSVKTLTMSKQLYKTHPLPSYFVCKSLLPRLTECEPIVLVRLFHKLDDHGKEHIDMCFNPRLMVQSMP